MKLIWLLEAATLADAGWAAAVRIGGKTYTHEDHLSAYADYILASDPSADPYEAVDTRDRLMTTGQSEEGFISPEGEFLTRAQAIARWRADRAAPTSIRKDRSRNWGDSSDIHRPIVMGVVD